MQGLVRDAVSGEPLARALVRIDGDAATGALTDDYGRFQIPGVPAGPQQFEVIRPGFLDAEYEAAAAGSLGTTSNYAHNVMVAAGLSDLIFTMAKANSIHGQIQLSTGDQAQGIEVALLKRTIENGRAHWQIASSAKTRSDGTYRFGNLADGVYAIYTNPAMDSDPATDLVEPGHAASVARNGYPGQYYPEARDLAAASQIQLQSGDDAEANPVLTLEPFYTITANVLFPGGRPTSGGSSGGSAPAFSAAVMDSRGHALPYRAQYDPATSTVQAMLPDGTYSLVVTAVPAPRIFMSGGGTQGAADAATLAGAVDFSVTGHAVANLHLPLSPVRNSPVQVNLIRSAASSQAGGKGSIFVTLSEAGGGIHDGIVSTFAQGPWSGALRTFYAQPGSYWVHVSLSNRSMCEASFMAGAANLAREPLVLGLAGPAAPLSLTLRDDCASLTLSLPASLTVPLPGEEPFYTVYAVPDFDSTADVLPQTLRPSTGGTITLDGLTPGSYHVYTFDKPVALEYRNPEALAALPNPGQAVTLSSGAKSNLVLEAPGR